MKEHWIVFGLIIPLLLLAFLLGYRRGVSISTKAVRETHGPMQIVVTEAQDGFDAAPQKINHPVTITVVAALDGGQVECRSKE